MDKLLNKVHSILEKHTGKKSNILAPITSLSTPPSIRQIYRTRKQRGVNIGSWFTLENWLTPSLFKHASGSKSSELDILQGMPTSDAQVMLENHWRHFIDDGDWEWMVAHGINTVRLPISYYHFIPGSSHDEIRCLLQGTDYEQYAGVYINAWKYIQKAIEKAKVHKIGVLVDLHAAPGAQNNDSHSGLSTGHAGLWDSRTLQQCTIQILVALATEIIQFDNVVGLELLNEPKNSNKLQSWYEECIEAFRQSGVDIRELPIYLSDSWDTGWYSRFVGNNSNPGTFLVLDHHLYRCFTKEDHACNASQHAANIYPNAHGSSASMLANASQTTRGSIVVGEWSTALNPASLAGYPSKEAKLAAQREWGYAQWEAYERFCAGYFFWTLKKEGASDPGWCFYTAVEKGVLPDFVDRGVMNFNRHTFESLTSIGKSERQSALSSHTRWWARYSPKIFQHWRFDQGYQRGWEDCLAFYYGELAGSQIGFSGQWKTTRTESHRLENSGEEFVWEFEHGFEQAIVKFNETIEH